jgi:hypothetical protein
MNSHQRFIEELQATSNRNVFVMMRYADVPQLVSIEASIRSALGEFGLIARLARDRALSDDLWDNIRLYMDTARYGIAVFEEIDRRDFNPNISLELGYMYALGRRCLLLKDTRMPRLPTDTCGKIYRDFDTYNVDTSISNQVKAWCEADLGLARASATEGPSSATQGPECIVYDSASDETFSTWEFDTSRSAGKHIRVISTESSARPGRTWAFELRADGTESIGVNKKMKFLHGALVIEYRAVFSAAMALNLYVCVIPMKGSIEELVEVGANRVDEPENAFSPYRIRHFIPHHHVGDGAWHTVRVEFDFRQTPTATYSICGIRINEGCPRPGAGALLIRNIRAIQSAS